MIDAAAIRELAARAKAQLLDGVEALKCGDVMLAQLHFSLSLITQRKLLGVLEGAEAPPPKKPLRVLCLVGDRAPDSGEPEWFGRKANSEDPNAA